MNTTRECAICSGHHAITREHCPFCGARIIWIANHSYERTCVKPEHRTAQDIGVSTRQLVRAYRSDIAFSV